ncbi:MAG: Fe-S protein assembly co-chaperone HscB [Pseudomonadota bacterium]
MLCDACGAIQSPRAGADKLALLGLPRRFAVDAGELDRRFRELSRRLHPDRFVKASPAERLVSLQAATALNDAYRTIKSPVARAEHLLELEGSGLAGNSAPTDPGLLAEMLEVRETLADARRTGGTETVESIVADMKERRQRALTAIGRAFARHDEEQGDRRILDEVRVSLVALRYYERVLAEADQEDS